MDRNQAYITAGRSGIVVKLVVREDSYEAKDELRRLGYHWESGLTGEMGWEKTIEIVRPDEVAEVNAQGADAVLGKLTEAKRVLDAEIAQCPIHIEDITRPELVAHVTA